MYRKPEFTSSSDSEIKAMENVSFMPAIVVVIAIAAIVSRSCAPP